MVATLTPMPWARAHTAQCVVSVASACWPTWARNAAAWSGPITGRRPGRGLGATPADNQREMKTHD